MDTNRIKKFATEARNKLKAGIAAKIITLGFDKNGNVPEHMHPQLMQGGSLWNGQLQTEGFYHQWQALYKRVQQKGIKEVYEEAAYTWFNRLVAIRILMKNQLIEPVLEYVDAARTPRIVDEARMGRIPQMQERQRQLLMELLDDDSKTTEQFAILVTAFCHDNPILFKCFGAMSDYTELLLPNDILTEGGFIDLLNHTEFITDEDFHSPELIGWLYQFYISERKDEVFAKKGKFEADEIPAATQIFTPNWIVKYMVQNTIGRIYLDNNPSAASEFKPKWQYLVEPSEPTPKEAIYKYKELTDLLVGDLACGSGHILNECFDLLYDLYIYEGYSRREAVEYIFTNNLRGIDLDTRAKQLATFALMLKACQKDSSFADAHILPKVLDMPTPIPQEQVSDRLKEFFRETPSNQVRKELIAAFELMQDADSLGSIMKFDLAESTQLAIRQTMDYWQRQGFVSKTIEGIMPAMHLLLILTDTYSVLVMNPPYLNSSKFDSDLQQYVNTTYPLTNHDLCTVFMDVCMNLLQEKGKFAMVNQFPWTSKSTYTNYRNHLIKTATINTLIELGTGAFPEMSGEVVNTVTFVISKLISTNCGLFYNLKEISGPQKEETFLKSISNPYQFALSDIQYFPDFKLLYWLPNPIVRHFHESSKVNEFAVVKKGLATGKDTLFLRLWSEINKNVIDFNRDTLDKGEKWIPINKGGGFRKWAGNREYVVNWENDGFEIKNYRDEDGKLLSRPQNLQYMLLEGNVYNIISSGKNGFIGRYNPPHMMSTDVSPYVHSINEIVSDNYLLACLNSVVGRNFINILCPSYKIETGSVGQVPLIINNASEIELLTKENIEISTKDWDSHETSWDFEANPLVALRNEIVANGNLDSSFKLSAFVEQFETIWEERFNQLHLNEEELNRQFIDIYGLQDELSPEVPKNEITILQQGEINLVQTLGSDNDYTLHWNEDVLMKQLISYAVGVWMGRYKLGTKGLHIAHPNPTDKELQEYWYGGVQVYIDDDGLIPVLPQSSPFDDNLSSRISDFVRITFGEDKLTENLNYIEQKLGTSIDQYVQKDFWKDHKKMYQNRPIYWLFSSSKGAFKCLAYMHRMNAYTAERVRSNYLLPYIEFLQNQIGELENRRATLSTAENRKLQNFQKALDECREYHERLQVVAEQAIAFDLDDGVVVNYAKFGDVLAKLK